MNQKFEKLNPGKKWSDYFKVLKPWANDMGDAYHQTMLTYWSETYFNAKTMDDNKTDRMMRLVDWCFSDEGEIALHSGIEGTDYKVEGKTVTATRAIGADGKRASLDTLYPSFSFWYQFPFWPVGQQLEMPWVVATDPNEQVPDYIQDSMNNRQDVLSSTKSIPTYFAVDVITTPAKQKFNVKPGDDIIKMLLSKNDAKTDVENLLKSYEAKGLSKVIEEVNAQATAMGINP
jgi:putative aldouronate transport system substrate-binding protein